MRRDHAVRCQDEYNCRNGEVAVIAGIVDAFTLPDVIAIAALGVIALGAMGVGAIAAVTAWRIVRPDRDSRPKAWVPRLEPWDVEPVTFCAPDGPDLRGWLLPPSIEGAPIVVCLHGFGMNRHEFEDVVPWLRAAGYGCLLFDFRGHGESGGTFTTVAASGEIEDARAAVRLVRDRFGPDVPLATYGISMGGAIAILVAGTDPGIRAVVTDSAFATLGRVLDHAFSAWMHLPPWLFRGPVSQFARLYTGIRVADVRPVDMAHSIAPRPFLLIHGTDDRFVDPSDANLIAAGCGPGVITWRPPGDHVSARTANPGEYRERVLGFLAGVFASEERAA